MTVKDKNDRKRMKQAKTQDMQALWKCTKTGGTKLVDHCASTLYDKKCGSDSGDERWRYHRAGDTRTASGTKGILCRSV